MGGRPFRFRAQAALDLRTRELEEAQRQLARAVEVRETARRRVTDADASAVAARTAAAQAQRTPGQTNFEWYRSWILRLDHERRTLATTLAERAADAERASVACTAARVRRESLERFRDKARAAHAAAEQAADMKLIDELATRRYAVRQQSATE